MEFVELIELLSDPYGRRGFFVVSISKYQDNQSCRVDFYQETGRLAWQVNKVASSYQKGTKKETAIKALNEFIEWYNTQFTKS